MELRHLRYFKTVADEGHITRAAEKLDMQQPPLSLQIKALEDELGVQLFKRLPRGVMLTKAGEVFYKDICKILDDVDNAAAKAMRVMRGEEGNIAIGFTSSVIFHKSIKNVIQDFRQQFPSVTMSLTEDGSPELVKAISDNILDVGFVRTAVSHIPNVQIYPLLEEPIMLAIPTNNPLADDLKKPVMLQDMSDQPLVLYRRSSGAGLYDRIIASFSQLDINPNIVQEAPRISSALNLVATGMGVSFVPASLCPAHLDGVYYRSVSANPELLAPIMLACRKTEASKSVQTFIQKTRRLAQDMTQKMT